MTHEGVEVGVTVRPVSSLLPHEETIPSHVDQVVEQLRRDEMQKDPVIVDSNSGAVLDGMHRLAAFSKLGLGNVICCAVDYASPAIELWRWARIYSGPDDQVFRASLKEVGIDDKVDLPDALEMLDRGEASIAAIVNGDCYIRLVSPSLEEGMRLVRKLDAASESNGWRRTFISEEDVDVQVKSRGNLVVMLQRLSKQDVVKAAVTRRLFPCKTSLHTLEPRPVAVNFPLKELSVATEVSIEDSLRRAKPRLLPAGSTYGGRRYKESLLLLNDK